MEKGLQEDDRAHCKKMEINGLQADDRAHCRKMEINGSQKPHVVLIPFLAPGHFIPFVDLAKLLARKGVAISFVSTPGNVCFLELALLHALNDGLDIRLLTLPAPLVEGLLGRERADLLPPESRGLLFEFAHKLQSPFETWMEEQLHQQKDQAPPVCIIYDFFMWWALDTAQKFSITSVLFNTCGAFASSLMESMACSIFQNTLEKNGDGSLMVTINLPHPLRLSSHEVCQTLANPDLSNPILSFIYQCMHKIGKGSGMLINTFHELEPSYIQHWKNLTGKPVWAIGPVNPQTSSSGSGNVNARGKMVDMDEAELVSWLDSQSPRSVVYVSFGSLTVSSKEQAHALAGGLEASGQAFVWAMKMQHKMEESKAELNVGYLPEGFVERTKGRGLIVRGWVPQLVILSHTSVGAFISHCGWNSALESISLGVPILAWPVFGDEHFNSKLFAELGVAIQFCENLDGIPEEERLKEVVRMALVGDKGKEMRERADKLKEMASNAIKENGSSFADLTAFVSDIYSWNSRRTNDKKDPESSLMNGSSD